MGIFGLIFLAVALVLIGVGMVAGLVACAVLAVLLGLGVVSSSVVIGLGTRSPAWGVRVFLLQVGLWTGIPAGAICGWFTQFLLGVPAGWTGSVYGALGGAVAGVAVALMLDFIGHRLPQWLIVRWSLRGGGLPESGGRLVKSLIL